MTDLREGYTEVESAAITYAQHVARDLGHAVVVARCRQRGHDHYDVFDSWNELGKGWTAIALVSVTGKVVAQAQE